MAFVYRSEENTVKILYAPVCKLADISDGAFRLPRTELDPFHTVSVEISA
jgi:hypothetical protein